MLFGVEQGPAPVIRNFRDLGDRLKTRPNPRLRRPPRDAHNAWLRARHLQHHLNKGRSWDGRILTTKVAAPPSPIPYHREKDQGTRKKPTDV